MAAEMVTQWVVNVVSIATGATAILVLIGIIDKGLNGRVRHVIRGWLGIKQTYEMADTNGDKLDQLHEDHMDTMGAQVAVAEHTQQLSAVVCDYHDVPEDERPFDLPIEEMQRRAAERGAAWPGEWKRGGG